MNAISLDTGLNEYEFAPGCVVRFNPTDPAFLNRLFSSFSELDKTQTEFYDELKGKEDPEDIFACIKEHDLKMRSVLDGVFNVPVCEAVFGDMGLTALSSNGVPAWVELYLAIIDQCGIDADAINRKGKAYVDKYTKKYQKKK